MPNESDPFGEEMDVPDPEEVEYPDLLLITVESEAAATERELDHARMFERGEQPPHSVSFRSPEQLRKLLTPRRFEVLHSIKRAPPESLRALADRLDRAPGDVSEDVHLLADYGIVYFREEGRTKQPFIPYEEVRVEVDVLSAPDGETSEGEASA